MTTEAKIRRRPTSCVQWHHPHGNPPRELRLTTPDKPGEDFVSCWACLPRATSAMLALYGTVTIEKVER